MEIGKTIYNQLGNKTLFMIGAKNLTVNKKGASFKIMRNSKKITHISIEMNSMDLYDVTFYNCRNYQYKIINKANNIYNDQLNSIIEVNTGLATKL
jgi:hypothetical protein